MSEGGGRYDLVYVHTDIPEGMTIREWRGRRAAERLTVGAPTRADRHQGVPGERGAGSRVCACRSAGSGCAAARHTGKSPGWRSLCSAPWSPT